MGAIEHHIEATRYNDYKHPGMDACLWCTDEARALCARDDRRKKVWERARAERPHPEDLCRLLRDARMSGAGKRSRKLIDEERQVIKEKDRALYRYNEERRLNPYQTGLDTIDGMERRYQARYGYINRALEAALNWLRRINEECEDENSGRKLPVPCQTCFTWERSNACCRQDHALRLQEFYSFHKVCYKTRFNTWHTWSPEEGHNMVADAQMTRQLNEVEPLVLAGAMAIVQGVEVLHLEEIEQEPNYDDNETNQVNNEP